MALAVSEQGIVAFNEESKDVALGARVLPRTGDASRLVFSDDGRWLGIGTARGHIAHLIVVDVEARREVLRVRLGDPALTDIAFSADGETVYVSAGRHLALIDRRTAATTATLDTFTRRATITVSSDDRYVAAGTDEAVQLYRLPSLVRVAELAADVGAVRDVWLTDDRLVAWGEGGAQAWALRREGAAIQVPSGIPWDCDRDSSTYYGQFRGRPAVQEVDWIDGTTTMRRLPGSADVSQVVSLGRRRVTLRYGGAVTVWEGWDAVRTLPRGEAEPVRIAANPADQTLAVALSDGSIELWGLDDARPRSVLRGHRASRRFFLAFSDDGRHLASATFAGEVLAWDLRDGGGPTTLAEREKNLRVVELGANGDVVYAAGALGVKEWPRGGGPPTVLSRVPHQGIHYADGRLAMRSDDGTLTVWDAEARRRIFVARPGDATRAGLVAVEPGGRGLRIVGRGEAFRLALFDDADASAGDLLVEAERAAGRTTGSLGK